jgi:hypothetical protein
VVEADVLERGGDGFDEVGLEDGGHGRSIPRREICEFEWTGVALYLKH